MADKDKFADWYDISSETYREYVNSKGEIYRIENPAKLFLNKVSGTHYILDKAGVVHTLLFSPFIVCPFLDRNGISFTTTRDGDTKRNER